MPANIAPLVIQASSRWIGNDGNWSALEVGIGTPPQTFDVFPSTVNGETWVPLPGSCPSTFADCASSRGVLSTTYPIDQGFQTDRSSTWSQTGIYGLALEESLFQSNDTGLYGLDTLSFGDGLSSNLKRQTVAGISTPNFWIGSLGLSIQPSGLSVQDEPPSPMLSSLASMNMTPSASYGLSVGASYREAAAGLVVGGYDASAFEPNDVHFNLQINGSRSLTVSLQSLVVTNTLEGQQAMPISAPQGLNLSIDSTVSQIWLPGEICDRMEALLGLQYDDSRELYLINSTARAQLLELSPTFTFTLAANSTTSNVTTAITLPYSAFNLEVGEPYYANSTSYFPIRQAPSSTQLVLGRAFLQEAYVVVDWDRGNFTLAQATQQSGVSRNIVPILQPVISVSESGLSTGTIAGIAVGAIVAVGLLGTAIWYFFWRKRKASSTLGEGAAITEHFIPEKDGYPAQSQQQSTWELPSPQPEPRPDEKEQQQAVEAMSDSRPVEAMSGTRYEMHEDAVRHQLMSTAVYELPGEYVGAEVSAQSDRAAE